MAQVSITVVPRFALPLRKFLPSLPSPPLQPPLFSLFPAHIPVSEPYRLLSRIDAHQRIIWACSWAPLLPPPSAPSPSPNANEMSAATAAGAHALPLLFATGSRDKKVRCKSDVPLRHCS